MITSKLVRASLDLCRKGDFETNSHLIRFMAYGKIILSARNVHPHQLKANCILYGLGFPSHEMERSQQTVFTTRRSA